MFIYQGNKKTMRRNMKRKGLKIFTASAVVLSAVLMSSMPADKAITRDGDTVVVNTQVIGKQVKGFRGATPVKIFIKKNKVVKVESLKNQETPQYFRRAATLLKKYEGVSVSKAQKLKVDAVSGATFSSNALKKNVELGLKYYKEHK